VTAHLIWKQAASRFQVPDLNRHVWLKWSWIAAIAFAALANSVATMRASEPGFLPRVSMWLLLGWAIAAVVAWKAPPFGLWLKTQLFRLLSKRVLQALVRLRRWVLSIVPSVESGYLRPGCAPSAGKLAQGHVAALAYGVVLGIGWVVLIHSYVQALGAVYLLGATLLFWLAGAAFFLDYYRIPVVVCVVGFSMFVARWDSHDHFYRVWLQAESAPVRTPDQILEAANDQGRPIVVVASAGGGIQSAAWTTAVLERLQSLLAEQGTDFASSIRLMSGVSGGSVGSMFFSLVADSPDRRLLKGAAVAARSSGLDAAMQGMLRHDFRRAVLPMSVGLGLGTGIFDDRGSSLETAWVENSVVAFGRDVGLGTATLDGWGRDAFLLRRPVMIFNATIVETGERLAFSTVPVSESSAGRCEFSHRYKADIAITTAARLSATFPMITPTARPAVALGLGAGPVSDRAAFARGGAGLHVVDGGYYENSGIVGAVEWLDHGLSRLWQRTKKRPRVLLIALNAFPRLPQSSEVGPPGPEDHARNPANSHQVPLFSLVHPLITMANVRNSAQQAFSGELLRVFRDRWNHLPGADSNTTAITTVSIFYDVLATTLAGPGPGGQLAQAEDDGAREAGASGFFHGVDSAHQPLSWHLRTCEIEDIQRQVEALAHTEEFRAIAGFFGH